MKAQVSRELRTVLAREDTRRAVRKAIEEGSHADVVSTVRRDAGEHALIRIEVRGVTRK